MLPPSGDARPNPPICSSIRTKPIQKFHCFQRQNRTRDGRLVQAKSVCGGGVDRGHDGNASFSFQVNFTWSLRDSVVAKENGFGTASRRSFCAQQPNNNRKAQWYGSTYLDTEELRGSQSTSGYNDPKAYTRRMESAGKRTCRRAVRSDKITAWKLKEPARFCGSGSRKRDEKKGTSVRSSAS